MSTMFSHSIPHSQKTRQVTLVKNQGGTSNHHWSSFLCNFQRGLAGHIQSTLHFHSTEWLLLTQSIVYWQIYFRELWNSSEQNKYLLFQTSKHINWNGSSYIFILCRHRIAIVWLTTINKHFQLQQSRQSSLVDKEYNMEKQTQHMITKRWTKLIRWHFLGKILQKESIR